MEKMIAFCGIVCSDCPTYKATQIDDDAERKRVAELWTEQYGAEHKPEDVNCDGCLSQDKKLIKFCHKCEVRACGLKHTIENCGYCDEYPCEKLTRLWDFLGAGKEAKARLEEVRKNVS